MPKHNDFSIFGGQVQKIGNFYPQKFQCKNRLPLCNDMWNLTVVWLVWLWCVTSQKWQKRTGFCQRRPNMQILSIFSGQMRNNDNIFPQSFNAKTDRLSFLFNNDMWNLAMVLLIWLWCLISQKWQNRTGFCQQHPNMPIMLIFCGEVQKIGNVYP